MRFDQLRLERFGHFADTSLDFTGDRIQLIYGLNASGKSTIRAAISELSRTARHTIFDLKRTSCGSVEYSYLKTEVGNSTSYDISAERGRFALERERSSMRMR